MPVTAVTEGLLIEVFSSIQGEGVLVGSRQIFVRMAGCNLACAYCDTQFLPSATYRVEQTPGGVVSEERPNPASIASVHELIDRWQRLLPHHSLNLTGGEPLLQDEVLRGWLPTLSRILPIHLETNGTLPARLPPLLPHLAWISMDIKLASLTGQATPWAEHRRFLALAAKVSGQVKIVIGPQTPREEIEQTAELVRQLAPGMPLVLQPVSNGSERFEAAQLLRIQAWAMKIHGDVRVIPQTHRFLGVL